MWPPHLSALNSKILEKMEGLKLAQKDDFLENKALGRTRKKRRRCRGQDRGRGGEGEDREEKENGKLDATERTH